jgi:hypothetical protein
MKYKLIFGLALLVVVIVINSCEKNVGFVPGNGTGANVPPPSCDTAGMTYSSGAGTPIEIIVNTQCATTTSCHAAGAPKANGDFSTWAGVQSHSTGGTSSPFYQHLTGTFQPMPNILQPGWTECDRSKLVQWIMIGAPQ